MIVFSSFLNLPQLGVGDTRRRSRPCLISELTAKNVVSVAGGSYHTLAISADHKVWAWGWGIHGQLGVDSAENAKIPVNVAMLNSQRVVQVAAGHAHSAALTVKVSVCSSFVSPSLIHTTLHCSFQVYHPHQKV